MFYSNGNYEAFIRPRKPKGVDGKSAYIVGAARRGSRPRRSSSATGRWTAADHHLRGGKMAGGAWTASSTARRIPLPWRARAGGPHGVPVGPDALDPVDRGQGRLGP